MFLGKEIYNQNSYNGIYLCFETLSLATEKKYK